MAQYKTTISSPWPAEKAFEYMADLRNFAKWDASVSSSTLVSGTAPGPDAVYDVNVMAAELRYRTEEYDAPKRVVAVAKTSLLYSYDVIEVTPTESGCEVLYDATFELNGVLGLLNPAVKLFFNQLGNKASAGLAGALEGTKLR